MTTAFGGGESSSSSGGGSGKGSNMRTNREPLGPDLFQFGLEGYYERGQRDDRLFPYYLLYNEVIKKNIREGAPAYDINDKERKHQVFQSFKDDVTSRHAPG